MASSSSAWKSSRRQRERIVGRSWPGALLTRKKAQFAGGSSRILSKALAAEGSSSSMLSITTTRQSDSAGVRPRNSPSLRTWATLMLRASPSPFSFGRR